MTPLRRSLERRRFAAMAQFFAPGGFTGKQADIAREFEVSRTSVSRWVQRWKQDELRSRQSPGRPKAFSEAQFAELRALVAGPPPGGKRRWTCHSLGAVLFERYGKVYHPDHAGKILAGLKRELKARKATSSSPVAA